MPRKLPWSTAPIPAPIPAPAPASRPSLRPRPTPAPTTNTAPSTTSPDSGSDSESDSDGTTMRPSDDRYIMVEDEFLTIAQTYTRSVHRAEYARLQSLAKSKNAKRISEIQRPVPGVTRMSREMLAKAKADVLKGLPPVNGDSESEDEDAEERKARTAWGKSSLGMLMCAPRKSERALRSAWGVRPGTRAAAGFVKAEVDGGARRRDLKKHRPSAAIKHEPAVRYGDVTAPDSSDSSDEDDDLDAPVRPASSQLRSQSQTTRRTYSQPLPAPPQRPSSPQSSQSSHSSQPSHSPQPLKKPDFNFDFGITAPEPRASSYRGRSMAARKQAEREKSGLGASPQGRTRPKLLDTLFPGGE